MEILCQRLPSDDQDHSYRWKLRVAIPNLSSREIVNRSLCVNESRFCSNLSFQRHHTLPLSGGVAPVKSSVRSSLQSVYNFACIFRRKISHASGPQPCPPPRLLFGGSSRLGCASWHEEKYIGKRREAEGTVRCKLKVPSVARVPLWQCFVPFFWVFDLIFLFLSWLYSCDPSDQQSANHLISDSERPTKIVSKYKKHNISSFFQKFEIAKFACQPKSQEKTFCGRRWSFYADVQQKKRFELKRVWEFQEIKILHPMEKSRQTRKRKFVCMISYFRHCVIPRRYLCRFVPLASLVKNTVAFDKLTKKKKNGKRTFCKTENIVHLAVSKFKHKLILDMPSVIVQKSLPCSRAN